MLFCRFHQIVLLLQEQKQYLTSCLLTANQHKPKSILYVCLLQVCSHAVKVQAPCPHPRRDPLWSDRTPGSPLPWRLPTALHQGSQRRLGRRCWPARQLCHGIWWVEVFIFCSCLEMIIIIGSDNRREVCNFFLFFRQIPQVLQVWRCCHCSDRLAPRLWLHQHHESCAGALNIIQGH